MGLIELRRIDEDTYSPWAAQMLDTFGGEGTDQASLQAVREEVDLDRSLGAFDGSQLVGTTFTLQAPITLPWGAAAQVATVGAVTVKSTHRRRGILTQMMRNQLDELHQRGEPLAGLWASEAVIYGRYGYGLGTYTAWLQVRRERSAFRDPRPVEQVVEVDPETALRLLPPLQTAAAAGRPGFIVRTDKHWHEALYDAPERRQGASRLHFVVHQEGGAPDGYAVYRTHHAWGADHERQSVLQIEELHALTREAYAVLWRFCCDVDLMTKVEAGHRSTDEPLRHLLQDPRALVSRTGDGLWLRLVDVADALARRGYGADGDLVLEIEDGFCPWNAGRLELTVEAGRGRVSASTRSADLTLDAAALATLYLGGTRATTLVAASRIEEATPGAAQRADQLFAAEATPWCPTGF